jgi:hypothetical protein
MLNIVRLVSSQLRLGIDQHISRTLSTSAANRAATGNYREEKVVTTPSGDTIVCWHPPPRFPYHLTQPLPRHEMQENSKLKTQYTEDMKELYHHKHPRLKRRDLMRITWTTKHNWFVLKSHTKFGQKITARKWPREKPYL